MLFPFRYTTLLRLLYCAGLTTFSEPPDDCRAPQLRLVEHPRSIGQNERLQISHGLSELLDTRMGRLCEKAEGDKLELLYFLERLRVLPLSYVRRDDLEMLWDLWYSSPSKVHCLLRVYRHYWQQSSGVGISKAVTSARVEQLSRQCIRYKLEQSIGEFRDPEMLQAGHGEN